MTKFSRLILLSVSFLFLGNLAADDWPRWLGPDMDSTWKEEGITEDFSKTEPKVLWRVPAGMGYSGVTVSEGRVFIIDYLKEGGEMTNHPSGKDKLMGKERVRALDAETGEELWAYSYEQPYFLSFPGGPRAVPTVAGDKVIALGTEGRLTVLDVESGEVVWEKDFQKDYESETPIWGHSAHPLVHDGLVYCMVGGEGSVVVAFDLATGDEKWRALSAPEPGYCPPTIIEQAGVEQLIVWHSTALSALDPKTGEELWDVSLKPAYGMAIAAPRKHGDLLFASGFGRIGALIKLATDKPGAEIVWRSKPKNGVYAATVTPFIQGDTIYGCDIDSSLLMAVDINNAERHWETTKPTLAPDAPDGSRYGTSFLTFHPPTGHFYLFNEMGELIIADLSPEGYQEISRWKALEPTNTAFGRPVVWSPPAFAMKSAFLRNDEEVIRVDLSAE